MIRIYIKIQEMEYVTEGSATGTLGQILCPICGLLCPPNQVNMCEKCIEVKFDITQDIQKQQIINFCRNCERYLQPPDKWLSCSLESRELLVFCLKKIKGLTKLHLVDAVFEWTEPHSKRIKVKVTVQKEVINNAILQKSCTVEFVVQNQMCMDCHRTEAKNFWTAVVQLRQRVQHKKTFFYLEQLILKHNMHKNCINIKTSTGGMDFYFAKKHDARKLVDFFLSVVPCRYNTSQRLISHDVHNNTYDYKFTFSVELVPICKDDVVCLPPSLARHMGNIGQICVCYRLANTIYLIDPCTLQKGEVSAVEYWRTPFHAIGSLKQFTEYTIMDINFISDPERIVFGGQGPMSLKHVLSEAWVVRSSELGMTDNLIHTKTHLGHLLKPGELAVGLELSTSNVNNDNFNKLNKDDVPDVVLVKKVYEDRMTRHRRRKWKLKHLDVDAESETSSAERDFEDFLEDLEEDKDYRKNISIYVDHSKMAVDTDEQDESVPHITLQEMMDELTIEDDGTVEEETQLQ